VQGMPRSYLAFIGKDGEPRGKRRLSRFSVWASVDTTLVVSPFRARLRAQAILKAEVKKNCPLGLERGWFGCKTHLTRLRELLLILVKGRKYCLARDCLP
jgi:hypothetical protein